MNARWATRKVVGTAAAVIGLCLAALVSVVAFIASDRERQKASVKSVRKVADLLEAYRAEHREYPAHSAPELRFALDKYSTSFVPSMDGWGHPFEYECLVEQRVCGGYVLRSLGKDGVAEVKELREAGEEPPRPIKNYNDDIVIRSGKLMRFPEERR